MAGPNLLPDIPERIQGNLWPGLDDFARRLAGLMPTLPHSAPVLLHGDWGAGKTTVLYALTQRIDDQRTIWFDAWRYDAAEALLPALVREVWSAADEQAQKAWRTDGTLRALWNAAVKVGMRVAPTVAEAMGQKNLAKLISAVAGTDFGGKDDDPPDDPTTTLYSKFSDVIHGGWGVDAWPVIVIDDLDRCRPDNAVALLDGIRTLVANAPELRCNFVVALDRGVLVDAISKKFEGISGYDGHRYLEKVFPLTFAVPHPGNADIAWLVDHYAGGLQGMLDDADLKDAIKDTFTLPAFANPRLIKRSLNRLALVSHFEGGRAATVESNRGLVDWLAATERWPVLRRMMQRYRDEQWVAVELGLNGDPPDEHLAKQLFGSFGAREWLSTRMFPAGVSRLPALRDAEHRLRACAL